MRWLVVLTIIASSRVAHADPRSRGDELFQRGKSLLAENKTAEACAAFDESQDLEPTLPTLLNQADCRERNGQLATAWRLFREAARQSKTAIDATSAKLGSVATERAMKLEARLSTVRIVVPDDHRVDGLEIRLETTVVEPRAWNAPRPIDGGRYKITASAPGHAPWSSTIDVNVAGDAKRIEVPALEAAESPALRPAVHAQGMWTTPRKIAAGFGGTALVGLAIGFGLGISASALSDDAEKLCPDAAVACLDAEGANAKLATARSRARAANISFGIAGGAALVAAVLWIVGTPQPIAVEPMTGPHSTGVSVSGRF